jgi:hypothetical protein
MGTGKPAYGKDVPVVLRVLDVVSHAVGWPASTVTEAVSERGGGVVG